MTPNLLTAMSTLTETENKNNNLQITKQSRKQKTKQNKAKTNQNHKKKKTAKHKQKKYSNSFTTMKSRPDTALTDFTSKLKGYLSHKCNVLLQKITCWTPVSRIFFRVSTLYRVGEGRSATKFRKRCTVLRGKEPRNNRKI